MATTYTSVINLAKHADTDPFDVSLLNDNADKLDTAMAKAYQGKAVHNWLDNSDFTNPVNQRGETSYTAAHGIDRWRVNYYTTGPGTLTVESGGIKLAAGNATAYTEAAQILSLPSSMDGKAMTFAVGCAELGSLLLHCTYGANTSTQTTDGTVSLVHHSGNAFVIRVHGTTERKFTWAALYKGTYTAATLPDYVPKGYAAELAECQRYYQSIYRVYGTAVGSVSREGIVIQPPMRIAPTITTLSHFDGTTDAGYTALATAPGYIDIQYTSWGSVTLALSADL